MKKPNLVRNGKYKTGNFYPSTNKYIGNTNEIIFRSGWEKKFMEFCETHPQILNWSSERTQIPYISPLDGKYHTYFVDFWIKIITIDNQYVNYLVEVKPDKKLDKPKQPAKQTRKSTQNYQDALNEWFVNKAKFETASRWCDSKGWKFAVITDKKHPWLVGTKNKK
jgi:hypothetical protein